MKCERCGQNEAVLKLTRVESDGGAYQISLCQSCAADESPYQKAQQKQTSFDMILKELIKQQTSKSGGDEGAARLGATGLTCPSCDLDFASYKSTYMLGCPDCYDAFEEVLRDDLMRFHRVDRHTGEESDRTQELARRHEDLRKLKADLQTAIDEEDFERAASLRDQISDLETQTQAPSETSPLTSKNPRESAPSSTSQRIVMSLSRSSAKAR
jgi:protein arginine kinase activator